MRFTLESFEAALREYLGTDLEDPKERKRLRILQAAAERFAHFGFRRTSIDDVARDAGVAKGTVYLYFRSKNELLLHAVALEKLAQGKRLAPMFQEGLAPRDRLRRYLETVFALVPDMPLTSRIAGRDPEFAAALHGLGEELTARTEQAQIAFLSDLLAPLAPERGWDEGGVRSRAIALRALLTQAGAVMEEKNRLGLGTEAAAKVLADLLVEGLG